MSSRMWGRHRSRGPPRAVGSAERVGHVTQSRRDFAARVTGQRSDLAIASTLRPSKLRKHF